MRFSLFDEILNIWWDSHYLMRFSIFDEILIIWWDSHYLMRFSLFDEILPSLLDTRQRPIGCLKMQVVFRKKATNYRALLRKMTYKGKASYGSSPPCITSRFHSMNRYLCCVEETRMRWPCSIWCVEILKRQFATKLSMYKEYAGCCVEEARGEDCLGVGLVCGDSQKATLCYM